MNGTIVMENEMHTGKSFHDYRTQRNVSVVSGK